MNDGYRDADYGFFDDVITRVSFPHTCYIKQSVKQNEIGEDVIIFRTVIIPGSLQAFRKSFNFNTDGNPNFSQRDGKFFCLAKYKLTVGDMVRKGEYIFRIVSENDYDYAGVRNYDVVRLAPDEIQTYDFDAFEDENFE